MVNETGDIEEQPLVTSAAAGDGGLLWEKGSEGICQNRRGCGESGTKAMASGVTVQCYKTR